jgi:hypothetical protein
VDLGRPVCVLQAFCRLEEESILRAVLFKPGTNVKSNTVILSTTFSIGVQQSASAALGQPQITSLLTVINQEKSSIFINPLKHSDHYIVTCKSISRQSPKYAHATIVPVLQKGFLCR